jgi:hypothetical protein
MSALPSKLRLVAATIEAMQPRVALHRPIEVCSIPAVTDGQRDLFLYQWSRRRAPGRTRIMLRGAGIGGLGGLAFALFLAHGSHTPGVAAYETAGQIRILLKLVGASVPAFAGIGLAGARRTWNGQEAIYQSLLRAGARVPDEKPVLTSRERGPMIAVAVTVVVLGGMIGALIWAANTGRL